MNELTGLIQLKVNHVYVVHIHFIIMATNRKELNGQRDKSIQIDLASPQLERGRAEGRGGGVGGQILEMILEKQIPLFKVISLPSTDTIKVKWFNTRSVLLPVSVSHLLTVRGWLTGLNSDPWWVEEVLTVNLIAVYYYSASGWCAQPAPRYHQFLDRLP